MIRTKADTENNLFNEMITYELKQGVYKIVNIKNKKVYIGESFNIDKRWEQHLTDLKNKNHHSWKLQNDFDIYGETNFEFKYVELIPHLEDYNKHNYMMLLISRENYYINRYNSISKGYNVEDTVKKLSEKNKLDAKYFEDFKIYETLPYYVGRPYEEQCSKNNRFKYRNN